MNSGHSFKHPKAENLSLLPSHFLLHATSHSGATTLPLLPFYSFQSPSLPLLSYASLPPLEKKKGSSWFYSHKRAEANWILAGLQFPGLWLQGGGRREDRTGETRQERKWRAKKEKGGGREKCCVVHFLKPTLTTAPAKDGLRYVHLSAEAREAKNLKN